MTTTAETRRKTLEERRRQLKVLRDDAELPYYEKAHLALFLMEEIDKDVNSRWLQLLSRANKALLRHDYETFNKILDDMGDAVGEVRETPKDGE